jgi:putative ABC transport system permease protein
MKDINDEIRSVNYSAATIADIGEIPYEDHTYLNQMIDVLYGKLPSNEVSTNRLAEGVLVISDRNQLPDAVLNRLGFNGNDYEMKISFEDLLNLEIKIAHSGVVYTENQETNLFNKRSNEDIYNDQNVITLKIVGIMRRKQNALIPQYQGIRYTSGVNRFILTETKEAPVVIRQQEIIDSYFENDTPLTSAITGQVISETDANKLIRQLGIEQNPSRIVFYHKDSAAKELMVEYLESYNEDLPHQQNIILNPVTENQSRLVDTTLSAVSVVLVVVASIALFVSISLVSILSYLSVVERTAEIGILRSIGARKVDIFNVFSAESMIVGIFSGILGLIMLYALTPTFNTLFEAALNVQSIIHLSEWIIIVLFFGNIIMTLVIGIIPALLASSKDPIKALKSAL